jgi:hypothetical protein
MLREASLSGVRINGYEDLRRLRHQLFQERFECRDETVEAYSRYMSACAPTSGTVEQQIRAHMKLYYSANGTMFRKGAITAWDRSVSSSKIKTFLGPRGMAVEVAAWRSMGKNAARVRIGGSVASSFAQYLKMREWQLTAWDARASDNVVEFVSRYVHDSKVDFLLNAEPFSYFSSRGVEESSAGIWQEGESWLRSKGDAVNSAVSNVVGRGKRRCMR